MAEILTQLAVWIVPPIALPRALPIVTEGGVLEAAVIRSDASKLIASIVGLVGTPATIEAAFAAAGITKSLALRNKQKMECWVWAAEEHVW
jgi:1-deoxy-D-xylulose 5-phosphate reductoisomerase